ncbi:transcriptional regulator [Adhaeribacter arboris]|uniref:Transcriptional regulator n=1 Tax=Adhaeribacter arboris TaxID=2072846 RepID=A0A2T2YCL4_9BACT|nr:helix-turn-helix transcriptional regulator [Adhaeribacter arboris]PSR53255.1 transcriptional regulator [Adhaeribacter arboris]
MKSEQENLKAIGERIKQLRIRKGYSSHESFAIDHDLGRMHYWKMESGKHNPTIKSLLQILEIHNITLKEFFSEGFEY